MTIFVESGHVNEYPFNHARIIYGNATNAAATATGADTEYPAALVLTETTYERWKPLTSGDSITMTFSAGNYDAVALAALSDLNFTLEVRQVGSPVFETIKMFRPDDGETLIADFTEPDYSLLDYSPDNQAIMVLLKKRQLNAIRITVTYDGTAPTLGVIRVGNVLEMARPFYQGHNPAMLSSNSTVRPNVSDSGEWLGASLIRQSRSLSMAWNNLKADWVRKNWVPFSQTLKTKPFFIAWNPLRFPSDCFYATAQQEPKPTNSGPRDYQSITLTATAYSDGSDPVVESLGSKTFSELFTFSRDSEATYYDVNGILQTATDDEPRFTYDPITNEAQGLLIEEARTNLFTDSSYFAGSAWSKGRSYIQPHIESAPDGALMASKLTETTETGLKSLVQSISFVNNTVYTHSIYVKAAERSIVDLRFFDTAFGTNQDRRFNLSDGTSSAALASDPEAWSITPAGNGWYRISITSTATATTSSIATLYILDDAGNRSYTGDGVSGVYAWGAQIEQGAFPTSYMPSTETFTSRASAAQYIDGNGDWQLAAVDEERSNAYGYDESGNLEYIGQLLEPARTNLYTYPRLVVNTSWGKINLFVNPYYEVSPDDILQAGKVIKGATASTAFLYQSTSYTTGISYTLSVFAKAGEVSQLELVMPIGASGNVTRSFDVSDGSTFAGSESTPDSYGIELAGNGWYRCWITHESAVTTASISLIILRSGGSRAFVGNNVNGIYIWGAQLEAGDYPTTLTPDATTFTSRASKATYYDSNGVIQEAAINEARDDAYGYDTSGTLQPIGLLIEPAATNLFTFNRLFWVSAWAKSNAYIQPYIEVAPDGSLYASKIIADDVLTTHFAYQNPSCAAGTKYTLSVFAKAAEYNNIVLTISATGGAFNTTTNSIFNVQTGTLISSGGVEGFTITPAGNGWYRVSASRTADNTANGLFAFRVESNSLFSGNYKDGVYIWGAQVEAGSSPTSLTPDTVTWSARASAATYYDASGIIQTASSGVARDAAYQWIDGEVVSIGLLSEPASTNLITYSEQLDNAAWSKGGSSITANAAIAPDGNTTADQIVMDGLAGLHYVQTSSISFTAGTVYTASIYLKYVDWQYVNMLNTTGIGTEYAIFDLVNGQVVGGNYTNANITDVGNGWFRCEYTFIAASTASGVVWPVWFSESASSIRNPSFVGVGSVYAWGAQVEAALYATSYIATTSATVTRAADLVSGPTFARAADVTSSPSVTRSADVYTSTALSRAADLCTRTPGVEFNKTAFTVYVEAAYSDDAIEIFFDANSGAIDNDENRIALYRSNSTNKFVGYIKDDAGTSASRSISGTDGAGTAKVALSFDGSTGAFIAAANGTSSSTTTTITEINPTRFIVGDRFDLTLYNLNDAIKNLKIYPVALSATELEALTA